MTATQTRADFSAMHERMQWYVDEEILSSCETVVLSGTEVVDHRRFGYMDIEAKQALREDAIYRMFSNTKIVTCVAAMTLFEEGKFSIDDPVSRFLPKFADMQVLKEGATSAAEVEPARSPMLIKQVLSHSSGLSYGFLEPMSVVDQAYGAAGLTLIGVNDITLEQLCDALAGLPLAYHPGAMWRYSFGTDVTARSVEVISGQRFGDFLKERIFEPLGMVDTDFHVPPEKIHRLVTMYAPKEMLQPMKGGLNKADDPANSGWAAPKAMQSGGAGLVSTVSDYLTFLKMIVNGGEWNGVRILKPETLQLMRTNQLEPGVGVKFPMWAMEGTVFGLGFALKENPGADESPAAKGEYHWGGMAGTHSWMAPIPNVTGFCLTNRMPGFWHPFSHDFKRMVYEQMA
ncbi:MAG TPA: serine hydrolase domain-containing protein [Tepidiformaceae bacterium]|nr:serine hydrolase domain-containing protein [Tepidiformaceae bacterium]